MAQLDSELTQRLNCELMMLERNRLEYTERLRSLSEYKGAFLRRARQKNGNYYYSIRKRGAKTFSYLGTSSHQDVINVRQVRFLEEAIKRIDRDIELITALKDGFLPYSPEHISESIQELYRFTLPPVSEKYARVSAQ